MEKQRWTCLDILKCLAALAVVEIHKPLDVQKGTEILILCRFAVPVFFMITGFFYPEVKVKKREWRQLRKIFVIAICANLFYLLWDTFLAWEEGKKISEILMNRLEDKAPEDYILWNFSPLVPHLWYLQALLYVLVIAVLVEYLGLRKLAYLAIPVLLVGNLIRGNYSLLFWKKDYCHIYYARNFLYCGLPFFWLGCWFGERKEQLAAYLNKKRMALLLIGVPAFWKMALMERKWLEKRNVLGSEEEYAGTILMAICIFLFFIGRQKVYVENGFTRALAKIGKEYSMYIYIFHYAVLQALSQCLNDKKSLVAKGYQQYGMIFIFVVTVIFVAFFVRTKRAKRIK